MKLYKFPTHKWERWFAWYPVKTEDAELVWWEYVYQKLTEAKIPNVYPPQWVIYKRIPPASIPTQRK